MFVKYRHIDNPEEECIYNSIKAYRLCPSYFRANRTQEEFDEDELKHFEADKEKGIILSYEVVSYVI